MAAALGAALAAGAAFTAAAAGPAVAAEADAGALAGLSARFAAWAEAAGSAVTAALLSQASAVKPESTAKMASRESGDMAARSLTLRERSFKAHSDSTEPPTARKSTNLARVLAKSGAENHTLPPGR